MASASLLSAAHAQPAGQLSPPPQPATGSISGRIVIEGEPRVPYRQLFGIVSAAAGQLMSLGVIQRVGLDDQGNFTVTGLEDGDYFLILCLPWEFAEPPGQPVPFISPIDPGGLSTLSGLPVTLVKGQAITDLEIVVRPREPMPSCLENVEVPSPPGQLSPPGGLLVGGPATGTGPARADVGLGYIALGLTGLAVLLLVDGLALQAQSSLGRKRIR